MINCPTCEFADFEKDKCKRLLIRLPHVCPYAEEKKPRNHFEEIKAMSMEQMAVWFTMAVWLAAMLGVNPFDGTGNDYNKWLEWLKEEI